MSPTLASSYPCISSFAWAARGRSLGPIRPGILLASWTTQNLLISCDPVSKLTDGIPVPDLPNMRSSGQRDFFSAHEPSSKGRLFTIWAASYKMVHNGVACCLQHDFPRLPLAWFVPFPCSSPLGCSLNGEENINWSAHNVSNILTEDQCKWLSTKWFILPKEKTAIRKDTTSHFSWIKQK